MAVTYKKTLTQNDYMATFNLGAFFDGSETARFAASKVNEKIADQIRAGTRGVVILDEEKNPKLTADGKPETQFIQPSEIVVEFTRAELDGFFIGVRETLKKPEVKANEIFQINSVCKVLGMAGRFSKYSEGILATIEKIEEPLDEETVEEPLDEEK